MRTFRLLLFLSTAMALVLGACAPAQATQAPATQLPATEQPVQDAPIDVQPSAPEATATLAPIAFAGPEMALGSTWLYVDGATIVAVPGGEFIMGRGDSGSDNPIHTVNLGEFWIYRTEVTNQQYALCEAQGQCSPPDAEDNKNYAVPASANDPVTGVTWDQAAAYCTFVHARLPSEAEWEKAARGPEGNIYPWGDESPACDRLNFNNCLGKTTRVSTYQDGMSYYEVADMSGNAFEWVSDWYDPLYYKTAPVENPLGPEAGTKRSIRSSGYRANTDQVAAAVRFFDAPSTHERDRGFRCVVEEPAYFAPYCEMVVQYGSAGPSGGPSGVDIPENDCPNPQITVGQDCGPNYTPFSIVTFNPPGALTTEAPGCTGGPDQYTCDAETTAKGIWPCTLPPPPGNATCPMGYTEIKGNCIPETGYDGACLPGFNYDPASQCCSATPGSTGQPFGLCEAGTYFSEADQACLPWPVQAAVQLTQFVGLKTCTPPGGGDDPGGGCAVQSCDQGTKWDPGKCSCVPCGTTRAC